MVDHQGPTEPPGEWGISVIDSGESYVILNTGFDHRTSRSGDPQMHTHVAVLAMAKTGDGRVLALDGRAIYGLSGALSAIYDFHRDKALMRDLNVAARGLRAHRGRARSPACPTRCRRCGRPGGPRSPRGWRSSKPSTWPPTGGRRRRSWWPRWPSGPPWTPARPKASRRAPRSCSPAGGTPPWPSADTDLAAGVDRGGRPDVAGPDGAARPRRRSWRRSCAPGGGEGVVDGAERGAGDLAGDGPRPDTQRRGGRGPGRADRRRGPGPRRRLEADPVAGTGPARRAGPSRRRGGLPGAHHRAVRHPLGDLRGAVPGGPLPVQHRHPGPDGADRGGHRRGGGPG